VTLTNWRAQGRVKSGQEKKSRKGYLLSEEHRGISYGTEGERTSEQARGTHHLNCADGVTNQDAQRERH
jgi:hypothetical protein